MRFGYTIPYVREVAPSLEFYERAFSQRRRFVHDSGDYAELETGATTLAFASHALASSNLPGVLRPAASHSVFTRRTSSGDEGRKPARAKVLSEATLSSSMSA